jgi:hypothetical protein
VGGNLISLLVAAGIILLLLKLLGRLLRGLFALLAGIDIAGFLIRVTQPASPIAIDIDHHGAVVVGMLVATAGGGLATLVLGKPKPRLRRYGDAGGGGEPPSGYGYSPGGYSPADGPSGGDSGGGSAGDGSSGW